MNIRPSRMITAPRIFDRPAEWAVSAAPTLLTAIPSGPNSTENPMTNSSVPSMTLARGWAFGRAGTAVIVTPAPAPPPVPAMAVLGTSAAPAISAVAVAAVAVSVALAAVPDIPVTYERYPGTSGRQHGDR